MVLNVMVLPATQLLSNLCLLPHVVGWNRFVVLVLMGECELPGLLRSPACLAKVLGLS